MIRNTNVFQNLEMFCCAKHFVRRGTAFIRVHGDGVLQILKVEKIPYWDAYEIFLDVFSMYDELDSGVFSAKGCVARYALVLFCGKHSAEYTEKVGDHYEGRIISLDMQVSLLKKTVMPFLDNIRTQAQLVNAMCKLDELAYSKILWNDIHKYVPFLYSGDYLSAQKVILAILEQHKFAAERRRLTLSSQDYEAFRTKLQEEDWMFIRKLQIAELGDSAAMKEHFQSCFERNCKLSKLVKPNSL